MSNEDKDKWHAAVVECPLCTEQWIAVWPEAAIELECPNCQNLSQPIIIEQ